MREAAAEERFEDAARYRNRLRAVERLRRAAGGRAALDRDDRRDRRRRRRRSARRCRCSRCATGGWSTATRSTSRTRPARTRRGAGAVLPRVLRLGAVDPAADPRAARSWATRPRWRRSSRSCAARASRCARRSAARSGGCRSSRSRTPSWRSSSETFVAETKRLRRVEALEELREALNLEALPIRIECFDISNIQGQEIVGSMVVFEDAVAKKAHYRKFGVDAPGRPGRLRGDGARSSRAASAGSRPARRPSEWDESFARDAEPRRDRRRQGPAVGRARGDAALRPAARRRDRARQARSRRCSCPGRPEPIVLPEHSAGPAAPAAHPRRGAPLRDHVPPRSAATRRRASRCSTSSRASARCGGARCSSTSARPSACSRRARRSWRACPACPRRRRGQIYAQLHRAGRA